VGSSIEAGHWRRPREGVHQRPVEEPLVQTANDGGVAFVLSPELVRAGHPHRPGQRAERGAVRGQLVRL
jgi:hypothetical protein